MSDVATPDAEATDVTDDASAVEAISRMLTPEGAPEPEVAEQEAETEEPTKDVVEKSEEAETEEFSLEDLPDNLNGLAEEIGITAEELAGHLKIPAGKDENGNTVMVTLAEAIRGNLRQADYTAKTMELAEARKAFIQQTQSTQQLWQQKFAELDSLIPQLQAEVGGISDEQLNRLIDDDPQEYLRQVAVRNKRIEALNFANYQRQQAEEQQKQESSQRAMAVRRQEQQKLIEKNSDLMDEGKRTQFESSLVETLTGHGFSKDEVSEYMKGTFDHRFIGVVMEAAKYRAMEKGKKTITKKVKGLPKVIRSGARVNPTKQDEVASTRNRMLRSGKEDDAVAFISGLLKS